MWSQALSSRLVISTQDSVQPGKGIYGSVASLPKGRRALLTLPQQITQPPWTEALGKGWEDACHMTSDSISLPYLGPDSQCLPSVPLCW